MAPFRIQIATGTPTPIYRQIVDQVRLATATGHLSPGDGMPSVRALAQELLVNPNTVARAYGELVHDGLLESQQGRGMFVARKRPVFSRAERQRRFDQALDVFLQEAVCLEFTEQEMREALQKQLRRLHTTGQTGGE